MRIVIAYLDGKPVYRDLGPANGASGPSRPSGSLVQGEPDWKARRKMVNPPLTANQTRPDDRPIRTGRPRKFSDDERIEARRRAWRESARRRREKAA